MMATTATSMIATGTISMWNRDTLLPCEMVIVIFTMGFHLEGRACVDMIIRAVGIVTMSSPDFLRYSDIEYARSERDARYAAS